MAAGIFLIILFALCFGFPLLMGKLLLNAANSAGEQVIEREVHALLEHMEHSDTGWTGSVTPDANRALLAGTNPDVRERMTVELLADAAGSKSARVTYRGTPTPHPARWDEGPSIRTGAQTGGELLHTGWLRVAHAASNDRADATVLRAIAPDATPELSRHAHQESPLRLERLVLDGQTLALAWHITITQPPRSTRQALIGEAQELSRTLLSALSRLPSPAAIARVMLTQPDQSRHVRRAILDALRQQHEASAAGDAEAAALYEEQWAAMDAHPTPDLLMLWRGVVPERLDAWIQEHTSHPGETWLRESEELEASLRALCAERFTARHGADAPWAAEHDEVLSLDTFALLLAQIEREDDPAAATAQLTHIVTRMRRAQLIVTPAALLLFGESPERAQRLAQLDAKLTSWAEHSLLRLLRSAARDRNLERAQRAGLVLRFIGTGPSLTTLNELLEPRRLDRDMRGVLEGHREVLEARIGAQLRQGGLSLAGDAAQSGGLSVVQSGAGALTISDPSSPKPS